MKIRKFEWSDLDAITCMFNEIGGVSGTTKAHGYGWDAGDAVGAGVRS